jgi:hypothetical protein
MISKERISLAMAHKIPDRVPVMCQLSLGHYFLNTPISPEEIWFTSEGFAEALITLQKRYGFDGILINIPGRPDNILSSARSIERTPQGVRIVWEKDETTWIPGDDNAHHFINASKDLPRADFSRIDPDNIEEVTGYVWSIYHIPWVEEKGLGLLSEIPDYFLNTIRHVKSAVGATVSVHGEVFSPFTHYMELFGYENALVSLMDDRAKAHAVLERLTETAISWGVYQALNGVDAVLNSSAFAGGSFISPRMYREFVLPYERKLNLAIRAAGVPVYTHTCGFIVDRLALMVETETNGVDTLDPPPLGNIELSQAKREIGDKVFIKGNMNAVNLLAYETSEQVISEASECIRVGKPGSGYILSTACSVSPHVQPWKLELLVPLAEKIGGY